MSQTTHDATNLASYSLAMDSNGDPAPTRPFSFATDQNWAGFDVDTMRVHCRAQLVLSDLRATRLPKKNRSIAHALGNAQLQTLDETETRRLAIATVDLRPEPLIELPTAAKTPVLDGGPRRPKPAWPTLGLDTNYV